jgi:non-ribosomal peptide synthetase component F
MDVRASEVEKSISTGSPKPRRVSLAPKCLLTDEPRKLSPSRRSVADFPRDLCVHELLSETAQQCSNSIAAEFQNVRLTYGELEDRSNKLAHFLLATGVGAEALVGLCLERSDIVARVNHAISKDTAPAITTPRQAGGPAVATPL